MPKIAKNKTVKKTTKTKLSPAERSQIAKDRWAKRRGEVKPLPVVEAATPSPAQPDGPTPPPHPPDQPDQPAIPQSPTTEQPPVAPESPLIPFRPEPSVSTWQMGQDGKVEHKHLYGEEMERFLSAGKAALPPAPPAPKKPKRAPQPKEFSSALKAAESRLAKAITERAEYSGKLAALQAEIPSLLQIINALKGPQQIAPVSPYDFSGGAPMGQAYATPPAPYVQPYIDPLAAIQGAAAAPPVSKAQGGAMQFTSEMLGGGLEGPEDDDIDRFITGPAASEKGWV